MHQADEFTSGEDEGTFVLMLGHLVVLAPKVSFVLEVELAQAVSAHNEVVTAIGVANFGQASVL